MSEIDIIVEESNSVEVLVTDTISVEVSTSQPGPKGDTGEQGIQGLKGDTGAQGIQGLKGDTGAQGIQGLKGDTGAQGIQGLKGDTGAQGIQGLKGDTGEQGIQGLKGDTGAQGIQGLKGDTGAQGIQGLKGDTGEQGIQGLKGDTGTNGQGVPTGGTTNQILTKIDGTNYNTQWSDNNAIQKGDGIYVLIRNNTGSILTKGQVVYTNGATGSKVTVALARANSDATSARTLGFVSADIAVNADGYVQIEGYLSGVNTSGLTDGSIVYLSGTTAGSWVTTKPYAPTHMVYLGVIAKAASAVGGGAIMVKVQNGYELDEIHNVDNGHTNILAEQDVLSYDATNSIWLNRTPAQAGIVGTSDSRLSDSRTPTVHASTHASGGTDAITVAQSQVTGLATALSGTAKLASDNTFTNNTNTLVAATGATKLIVKAGGTQSTTNLQEWQSSGSTPLLRVNNLGELNGSIVNGSYPVTFGVMTGHNPEGKLTPNPMLINDIAYARLRGSTFTFTGLTPYSADIDAMFNGSSTFWNVAAGSFPSPQVIEFTSPVTLTYGAFFGISFGNSSWAVRDITLEAFSEGIWKTVATTTSNSSEVFMGAIPSNSAVGTTQFRITLATPLGSAVRITHIFAYNYASPLAKQIYLGRDGGTLYGDLQAPQKLIGSSFGRFGSDIGFTDSVSLRVSVGTGTNIGSIVRGANPQTADLQQWQTWNGTAATTVASISSAGILTTPQITLSSGNIVGSGGQTTMVIGPNRNAQFASAGLNVGGGVGVIGIANATTAPTTNPSGASGGILYVDTGALKYMGTTGSAATIVNADGTMASGSGITSSYYANNIGYTFDFTTSTNAKSILGGTTAGVTVSADSTYEYELYFRMAGTYGLSGSQTPSFGLSLTTLTLSPVLAYNHVVNAASNTTSYTTTTTLTTIGTTTTRSLTALTTGNVYYFVKAKGVFRVTGTGTAKVYPSISMNAANFDNVWLVPAGGVFFKATQIGNGTVSSVNIS